MDFSNFALSEHDLKHTDFAFLYTKNATEKFPLFTPNFAELSTKSREHLAFLMRVFSLEMTEAAAAHDYFLSFENEQLALCSPKNHGAIVVDFASGALAHRRQFGGGRGQLIAKAIGLRAGKTPNVLDLTAGLGRDAFILATLGCEVCMIERSPIAAALLFDALYRAAKVADLAPIVGKMALIFGEAAQWLNKIQTPFDVCYLDPMFPDSKNSAAAKKEMQAFQACIGEDADASELLAAARRAASQRIAVKRPRKGDKISQDTPHAQIIGKSTRFDLYMPIQ